MADAKTEKQKVQEITEKLEQGIKELFESEKYKTCLSDQYYGFIFQKNHSLDTFRNIGSILRD